MHEVIFDYTYINIAEYKILYNPHVIPLRTYLQ